MRFSLQEVKKSVHRRNGELAVTLHFLRPGELQAEIARLLAYYEQLLGRPQREFSMDSARACIGDYRIAQCLVAVLSNWYVWRSPGWMEALANSETTPELGDITSPVHLRLALYDFVNQHSSGFLASHERADLLRRFGEQFSLSVANVEYLLALDSEDEAVLLRAPAEAPSPQEVATLYNQWVFEAALFNASSAHFVIDCQAFTASVMDGASSATRFLYDERTESVGTGFGAVMKRLCYLARKLGVYYDLDYERGNSTSSPLLRLTLYGPQEVTGAPQQYGLRLARLCRSLLGYGHTRTPVNKARSSQKTAFRAAIVEAEATVHFLQRSYLFAMDGDVVSFITPSGEAARARAQEASVTEPQSSQLFDSGVEQSFAQAFTALARAQGVDGWRLEREPEPLLLDDGIFIPDFALTRAQQRIYVEILGFWTPSYRERKIQKLRQLQGRNDLLLALPLEAKAAFAEILTLFPVVIYQGQLSATEVVQLLRERYDDFARRLTTINVSEVRARLLHEGLLAERACYDLLTCYRRSELQVAAQQVLRGTEHEMCFVAGLGLIYLPWLKQVRAWFFNWLEQQAYVSLAQAIAEVRLCWPVLAACDDSAIETLLSLWPEVQIGRESIFQATVSLQTSPPLSPAPADVEKTVKKQVREKRTSVPKSSSTETVQGNLWG